MNPRLSLALDFLKVKFPFEVEGAFITYEDNDCKIEAYPSQIGRIPSLSKESEKDLSINQLVKIVGYLTGKKLILGRDEPSIWDSNHRKLIYLRLHIPSGVLQLEYQDGEETASYDEYLSDLIRSTWTVDEGN